MDACSKGEGAGLVGCICIHNMQSWRLLSSLLTPEVNAPCLWLQKHSPVYHLQHSHPTCCYWLRLHTHFLKTCIHKLPTYSKMRRYGQRAGQADVDTATYFKCVSSENWGELFLCESMLFFLENPNPSAIKLKSFLLMMHCVRWDKIKLDDMWWACVIMCSDFLTTWV